jgi:hypothetical protein
MQRSCSFTSCSVSSSWRNCETVIGASPSSGSCAEPATPSERPNFLASSSSWPSQCATSCQTTCFTSARKSPLEHRRIGPRKTKIRSGAILCRKCCGSVPWMPLYKPSISLPAGQFLFSRIFLSTSTGGSSAICIPGKSGSSLIFCGGVLKAHFTISSNVCEPVAPVMCESVPGGILSELAHRWRNIPIALISHGRRNYLHSRWCTPPLTTSIASKLAMDSCAHKP